MEAVIFRNAMELVHRAFDAQDRIIFEQALETAKEATSAQTEVVELLDEARDLFPLGECMEPILVAENLVSCSSQH